MTKLIVEITSKDMIRPSEPTPNHRKTLEFSNLDQIAPRAFMPLIFYYQSYGANSETSKLLKESLSRTLVQFYPFAGRLEKSWIDCNDEGVPFYEANVVGSVVQVMGNPNNSEEFLLLPSTANSGSIVAAIQVNRFSCGGVAIGYSLSHKIGDAATSVAFISAWAENARGDSNNNTPQINFAGASLFPRLNLEGMEPVVEDGLFREKIVTRRLRFSKEMIDMLKKRCAGGVQGKPPTSVEAVSAFLWKQFIKVARAKPTPINISAASQAVNLRTVKSSGIPKNSHGNIYTLTIAFTRADTEIEYPEAVNKLRDAVKKTRTSSFFSEKMQTGIHSLETKKAREKIIAQGDGLCFFSDMTKFPVYQVNFGWGTPIWVSNASAPLKNNTIFLSTKCGQGIEAWMAILEQDVAAFEQDQDFLSLTSSNVLAKL